LTLTGSTSFDATVNAAAHFASASVTSSRVHTRSASAAAGTGASRTAISAGDPLHLPVGSLRRFHGAPRPSADISKQLRQWRIRGHDDEKEVETPRALLMAGAPSACLAAPRHGLVALTNSGGHHGTGALRGGTVQAAGSTGSAGEEGEKSIGKGVSTAQQALYAMTEAVRQLGKASTTVSQWSAIVG
jgi:hypothetical protein